MKVEEKERGRQKKRGKETKTNSRKKEENKLVNCLFL